MTEHTEPRTEPTPPGHRTPATPAWVTATAVAAVIAAVLAALALLAGKSLPERTGPPIEIIAVERTVLDPGRITLTLRNTGPDPVTVAQVSVNDTFVDVVGADQPLTRLGSTEITLDYPWITGQPYLVSILTSTGLVIEHQIPAAVATPEPNPAFFGLMALLGTYVGIVPVLLGMLLLPVLRRTRPIVVRFILAVTVGLLAFLAFDAAAEGIDLATGTGAAFGGAELVALGAAAAFLALTAIDGYLRARRQRHGSRPGLHLATMIAIGIGLHNLGEGLAIGSAYAIGELALGAFLVIGFTLHNTTEGIAIVAPLADRRTSLLALLALGLIAGAPAVLGAVIGASVGTSDISALLLGVGVGAIVQVIVQIAPSLRPRTGARLEPIVLAGIGAGLLVMYLTGLMVTV